MSKLQREAMALWYPGEAVTGPSDAGCGYSYPRWMRNTALGRGTEAAGSGIYILSLNR